VGWYFCSGVVISDSVGAGGFIDLLCFVVVWCSLSFPVVLRVCSTGGMVLHMSRFCDCCVGLVICLVLFFVEVCLCWLITVVFRIWFAVCGGLRWFRVYFVLGGCISFG